MLKSIGTDGCTTTHGGVVKATQTTATHNGIPMLQMGDGFVCPQCKTWSTIIQCGSILSFNGIKAALEGDLFSCGAKLVAQQSTARTAIGSTSSATKMSSALQNYISSLTSSNDGLANKLVEEKEAEEQCACNREITLKDLTSLAVGAKGHLTNFVAPLNETFKLYGIKTCIQKAYFISQTFLETGEYKTLEEKLNNPNDEQTKYNGYKGRGLIQLTWKDNYVAYGKYKGEDFTGENRKRIATPKYAVDSAAWFWRYGKSRDLNDLSIKNDLIGVSAVINGGFNHYDNDKWGGNENRRAYLLKAFKSLNVKNCKAIPVEILNSLEVFNLENSIVYNMVGECFGWGLWHDPAMDKKGCTKSVSEMKKGYARFLELAESQKFRPTKRYGYTIEAAKQLALGKIG